MVDVHSTLCRTVGVSWDVHSTLCRTVGVSWWMYILHFVGR